jgi:hypothetical protein
MQNKASYPVTLDVDYPDRELNRLTTVFRCVTMIPPAVMLGLVSGTQNGPFLFLPVLLMILVRRKYPRWWFDWNLNLTRFFARVAAYGGLLTDEFPSTQKEQGVHISIPYPDVEKDLAPAMPLVKWFLAIPHVVILLFLAIAAGFCILVAWFAILFTGRYPRPLFDFVVGTARWALRVNAYAVLLVTDVYPPFSLK